MGRIHGIKFTPFQPILNQELFHQSSFQLTKTSFINLASMYSTFFSSIQLLLSQLVFIDAASIYQASYYLTNVLFINPVSIYAAFVSSIQFQFRIWQSFSLPPILLLLLQPPPQLGLHVGMMGQPCLLWWRPILVLQPLHSLCCISSLERTPKRPPSVCLSS